MSRSARLVIGQDHAIDTSASTTVIASTTTTTKTLLPPPTDTQLDPQSPPSPAPSLVLSPAPSENNTTDDDKTVPVVRLPLPDDILSYICAALRDMMENPLEPTATDGVILRTLLGIQVASKAGWKAANPFIWETLRFEIDDDYVSFFSPITRLLREARCVTKERTASRVIKMINDDARRHAEVDRFFRYTRWIRTIHIHCAPPLAIQEELSLIGDIAKELVGTSMCLGEEIDLNLSNDICLLLMHDCRATKATFRFRQLAKGFLPAEITIFSYPEERVLRSDMSWKDFEKTGKEWKDVPMFIYDSLPGQLSNWCHRHTTVFVAHPSRLIGTRPYDAAALSYEIGWLIANCTTHDDPDCTATELELYAPMEYIGEHSYAWTKREEADEDEEDDTDEAIALFTNEIIVAASLILEEKGHLGCTKEVHAERIRNAFESGRLVIGTYA